VELENIENNDNTALKEVNTVELLDVDHIDSDKPLAL
jgi:hypothetical protein